MHDGMQYDLTQRQGHEPLKVGNTFIFKSYLRYLQWKLATDHGFLNLGTISKFVPAGFLIFVKKKIVFVSLDFELCRNVVDFVLVLIEIFCQLSQLRHYERILVEIVVFEMAVGHFERKFQGEREVAWLLSYHVALFAWSWV